MEERLTADLMTKIKYLNSQTYITQADMSPLVQFKNIVKKRFGLLTRNRIVVMYERYFGQVSFLFLNIASIDGRVLSMNQLSGMWSFHDYFIFNKYNTHLTLFMVPLYIPFPVLTLDLVKGFWHIRPII